MGLYSMEKTTQATIPRGSMYSITQRVHVLNNQVLGIWVLLIIVQVLGKYMIIRYLDP